MTEAQQLLKISSSDMRKKEKESEAEMVHKQKQHTAETRPAR